MKKRQILINAIMSVIQIVVIGVSVFILYRFLLITIGVEHLGIWSLVLATTSVTQIANFGLSGSIVKFVAKYNARGENEKISSVIQTASLSVAAFVGMFLLIGYLFAKWILGLVIPIEHLYIATSILPYALIALWLMVITGIFQSGLDGFQRIDLRSLLLMGGAVIHLLLCFMLAPAYGLIGVAYARVIQNITILLVSWYLLKKRLPSLPLFPYKWSKDIFKEIIGYAINFQVISITVMFYDPITKVFISKFGGLSMVGYYEMASKMIQQFRALIVSANQVLVPAIAELKEKTPEKIHSVYLSSYQLLFYLALPLYSLIIVSTPLISELWIGHYERTFIIFATLLAIGWFLNSLNAPSYFAYLGIGKLHWNVTSHIVVALLNAGLGFLLGILFGGIGVVAAWVFSLGLGSSVIYLSYHIKHKIPLIELLPKSCRILMLVCFLVTISNSIIQNSLNHSQDSIALKIIIIILFSIVLFIPFWANPMRVRMTGWISDVLLKKATHRVNT